MTEALSDTQRVVGETLCPHAKRAMLVHDIIETLPGDLNPADTIWRRVQSYAENEQAFAPDGLFLSLPTSMFGDNIDGLARGFKNLFCRLVELDDRNPKEELARAADPDYRFTLAGIDFHPLLFSLVYPENNPRHSSSEDRVLLLLQTESSFDRHMPKYPDGSQKRWLHRLAIRETFARALQPYQKHLGSRAIRYLSPEDALNEPPVMWYL